MSFCTNFDRIEKAYQVLKTKAKKTPVLQSDYLDQLTGAKIFLKCENLQKIGAFKYRGAYWALSQLEHPEKGVVTFSSGNHAQAIALAGRELGIKTVVVMPSDAPKAKIEATRAYGAEVILFDRETEDREAITNNLAQNKGMTLIPPYNHPHVIEGQGTLALELFSECGELDYLFVPVGGGGLISGSAIVAQKLSPACKVIGTEPETANDAYQSFRSGTLVKIPLPKTICDGAQTQVLGSLTFPIIQELVHDFAFVNDEQIKQCMRILMEKCKIVVEPTGCLALAVALSQKNSLEGKRVGIILSGGNVDLAKFALFE